MTSTVPGVAFVLWPFLAYADFMKPRSPKVKPKTAKPAPPSAPEPSPQVLTIGHSTRPIEEFIRLLQAHGVDCLVDVRTIPRSRHNPQFNTDALPVSLKPAGIGYEHVPALGGLRRAAPDSVNGGWRNASFRGYADYMQTSQFAKAVETLVRQAGRRRLALMCAEAVPWRCHRSLIADALVVRGIGVEHIMSLSRRQPHVLTPFAKAEGQKITYPASGLPSEDGQCCIRLKGNFRKPAANI
jgi:hypothetical protein